MTTANTHGARGNDGPTDNVKQGVFAGEARTITMPSIPAIRGNDWARQTLPSSGPFVAGKVPTKSEN